VFAPEDHQVDNRKLAAALRVAAEAAGAEINEQRPVNAISSHASRVDGIVLADGSKVDADVSCLPPAPGPLDCRTAIGTAAAGAADQGPDAVATNGCRGAAPVARGVGARRLLGAAPRRPLAHWGDGGREGLRRTLTAGGVLTLLEAAWRAVPAVEELPIEEMWVGHRPGSRDDAPILGEGPLKGLVYATGHHRNGSC